MLSYIFSIKGFVLSLDGLLLAFLFGAVLAYFTNISLKTLYRIPYMFMLAVAFLGYVLLTYAINLLVFRLIGTLPLAFLVLLAAVPPFLFGYIAMYLSVSRARDGFGKKGAAWLLIIPLLNLGLFIVTLDDDPEDKEEKPINRNPIGTPAFMNGATGVIVATIIFTLSFTGGMMLVTYPSIIQIPELLYMGTR
ncbi:hypothetical protein H3V17_09290 [Bartonella sp. M0283]|uniref:hypothetical protein n=1 Tax=Bartonella sp. M0283 TaxID=2751016 RepID=UPI0018DC634D|nr:hypothetical protein [Bartonella sp. M0283]MBI0163834.1 hypothetical protein [Bartonella sp. M0283]